MSVRFNPRNSVNPLTCTRRRSNITALSSRPFAESGGGGGGGRRGGGGGGRKAGVMGRGGKHGRGANPAALVSGYDV